MDLIEVYETLTNKPDIKVWERFWANLKVTGWANCWEWQGTRFSVSGYGRFQLENRSNGAHRLMATWAYGNPINRNIVVDHIVCGNRKCCNPLHLIFVPNLLNSLRQKGMTQTQVKESLTQCKEGHMKNVENWYMRNGQFNSCKICCKKRYRQKSLPII